MAKKEHVELLKSGVDGWNAWRVANPQILPDLSVANLGRAVLSGANLSSVDFTEADLGETDLRNANLSKADLAWANLSWARSGAEELSVSTKVMGGADLRNADLSGAILIGTNLFRADLRNADLSGALLNLANFNGANLDSAKINGAIVGGTIFADINLSTVKGLDTVSHRGPSSIGLDTLFISDGKIPDAFLRGAGVPDDFITYLPSLLGRAIEFYSSFISYSHGDEEFARLLHSRMRSENLRVWYAPEDIQGGKKLHEEIFRAIQVHDKLLLVLSEHSMKSEWVITEIHRARKVEREENRRKLFPIRLVDFETIQKWECFDADSGKDLAVELREYYIPNFSHWKNHDAFEAEFGRLLRDLRAEGP